MPPKTKVTREEIIDKATELVRLVGADGVNARSVATALGCSTQPIFSNFSSMDELRLAIARKAETVYGEYMKREIDEGKYPPYKASGMAYIRFAKEERELFKLLYMRDRSNEIIPDETELGNEMETIVRRNTGLYGDEAKLFHLEMWAYVHGIASMVATGYLELDTELVSRMLTDSYQGLRKQFGME